MDRQTNKHAFVIMVGASHAEAARAVREDTLDCLARHFDDASFDIRKAEDDLVDGKWLLIASRGSIGDGVTELKPMPPIELYRAIDAMLEEIRFLEPPALH